jgi:hypothetical protein
MRLFTEKVCGRADLEKALESEFIEHRDQISAHLTSKCDLATQRFGVLFWGELGIFPRNLIG